MSDSVPPRLDTTVPHSARIWNYWLGGKDNFAVDRAAGEQFLATFPDIAVIARATRAFMNRAVQYLAGEVGIRQFLDIGTGLPTVDSTHEIAQQIAPESRIVYVNNDPVVLVHAHALLRSTPQGATDYLDADLREPEAIVAGAAKTLDFTQPVAVMLLGIMGHITDDGQAQSIVRQLMDAAAPGELPGTQRRHQRHPRPSGRGGPGRLQRQRRGAVLPAQPRADRPLLRRAGPRRARGGLLPAMAAPGQLPRQRRRDRCVLRGRPQALTPASAPGLTSPGLTLSSLGRAPETALDTRTAGPPTRRRTAAGAGLPCRSSRWSPSALPTSPGWRRCPRRRR